MTDDTPIPDDDAVANRARHALQRLADVDAGSSGTWGDVQMGARRVRRRRVAAVATACAIVLVGAGTAAAVNRGDGKSLNVAGEGTSSSTSEPPAPSTPSSSTSVPTSSTTTTQPLPVGHTTTPGSVSGPTTPSSPAPQPGDFSGLVGIDNRAQQSVTGSRVAVGTGVDVGASVQNISDHPIWASSTTVPTSLATICTGQAPGTQTLWWMTNILLAPGDADGRDGTFTPTAAYTGTVSCEVDVVTTDQRGITFDTSAGGDMATASIVGRVLAIAPVSIEVVPARWTVTTTGKVGPLQFGTSTDADVRAAAGTPDATTVGTFGITSFPDYGALGYDCSDKQAPNRIPLHVQPEVTGPFCRTIFFFNTATQTLAGFETTTDAYQTENGTTAGMTTAEAEQRESQTVKPAACRSSGINLGSPDDPQNPGAIILEMGTNSTDLVTLLSAEDNQIEVGVQFC
jgi:hypothetical protein